MASNASLRPIFFPSEYSRGLNVIGTSKILYFESGCLYAAVLYFNVNIRVALNPCCLLEQDFFAHRILDRLLIKFRSKSNMLCPCLRKSFTAGLSCASSIRQRRINRLITTSSKLFPSAIFFNANFAGPRHPQQGNPC